MRTPARAASASPRAHARASPRRVFLASSAEKAEEVARLGGSGVGARRTIVVAVGRVRRLGLRRPRRCCCRLDCRSSRVPLRREKTPCCATTQRVGEDQMGFQRSCTKAHQPSGSGRPRPLAADELGRRRFASWAWAGHRRVRLNLTLASAAAFCWCFLKLNGGSRRRRRDHHRRLQQRP